MDHRPDRRLASLTGGMAFEGRCADQTQGARLPNLVRDKPKGPEKPKYTEAGLGTVAKAVQIQNAKNGGNTRTQHCMLKPFPHPFSITPLSTTEPWHIHRTLCPHTCLLTAFGQYKACPRSHARPYSQQKDNPKTSDRTLRSHTGTNTQLSVSCSYLQANFIAQAAEQVR